MNINDLGYFIYMQEQEEKQQQELIEVNVKNNTGFVGDQATQKEDQERKKDFSRIISPAIGL